MTAAIEAGERRVTKQQIADHLQVTRRWVESQQPLGLPYLRTGGMNRYVLSEVEAWLRERYASTPRRQPDAVQSRHTPQTKVGRHVKYKGHKKWVGSHDNMEDYREAGAMPSGTARGSR